MKNLSYKFLFLFLAFGLFACSTGAVTPAPSNTPPAQATITEAKPLATETPHVTPAIPTATETVLPTVTFEPSLEEAHLTIKCLDISPAVPENADWNGTIFLETKFVNGKGYSADYDAKMDLATRQLTKRTIPKNTQFGGYKVSPDGKQLAYWKSLYSTDKREIAISIMIENYDGKVLKELRGNLDTWDTFYWLDNKRIVIGMYGQPFVLNIFTREGYDLSKWYAQSPGGLHIVPVWDVNGIFDSQLSRLFYIQEDGTLLLWDLQAKKTLAKLDRNSVYNPAGQPKWSWDDKEVVFAYPLDGADQQRELFSVSRNGEISQLTDLGKYYSQAIISKFSWSPDGRKIAFFFLDLSKENSGSQLAILDMETLKAVNYCNVSGLMFRSPDLEPVWSPDGTKLLIGRMEADQTVKTILVDIANEYAAPLVENLVPAGWMKPPNP